MEVFPKLTVFISTTPAAKILARAALMPNGPCKHAGLLRELETLER